jgi:tetratricopeptide (TPR) repeat protein
MARLHPHNRPLDFLVAAHRALGDEEKVQEHLQEGLAAHCEPMPEGPEKDNCTAWYYALAQVSVDEALERIERALARTGERSDFLDTKAMVHLARHEYELALKAAHEAARLSPDDVYMLWQAERIAQIAAESQAASSDTGSFGLVIQR